MDVEGQHFKYRSELESYLNNIGVSKCNVCLVGSIALSIRGVREHGDLDICARSDERQKFFDTEPPDSIGFHEDKYANIGVSCDELITNEEYHEIVGGFKVARLELEFSHKLHRDWPKDRTDVRTLEEVIVDDSEWDWDLVTIPPSAPDNPLVARLWHSLKQRGAYRTGLHLVDMFRPAGSFQWIDRYQRPIESVRMGGMLGREFRAHTSIGYLLSQQYENGAFRRMDLVKIFAILNERGLSGLEDDLPEIANQISGELDQATSLLPMENVDVAVTVDPDMRILEGGLHVPVYSYHGYDSIPVDLRNTPRENDFVPVEYEFDDGLLGRHYCELLLKHGCFFFAVLWPKSVDNHDEIENMINDHFTVRNSVEITFETAEQLRSLTSGIYSVQKDFSWYTREWVAERVSHDGDRIRVVLFEVPNPTYDRSVSIEEEVAMEVKSLKKEVRKQFDQDKVMHATDNHHHNRMLVDVFGQSSIAGTERIVSPDNFHDVESK